LIKENNLQQQLILNPVENLPNLVIDSDFSSIHGLYVSDKPKTDEIVINSIIGFSGHEKMNQSVLRIYENWNRRMKSDCFSMRLLSGLHAHIVLFMGLGSIGDKVLILPVKAGGHYATPEILKRLGYTVIEAIPDNSTFTVDFEKTLDIIKKEKPNIIFIDRSEGIYYEDFTTLINQIPYECIKVFDASQYLTNVLESDFKSPFDMGFDIIMSTLHKNFPGPQKAMVCSKKNNYIWHRIQDALSMYVSSLHIENIFLAEEVAKQEALLKIYSESMLKNCISLEKELSKAGLPVIKSDVNMIKNHHLWLKMKTKNEVFDFYKKMEQCNLLVNYRKLPYELGYGIRMGTAAATLQGLNEENINSLAALISEIYYSSELSTDSILKSQLFISELKPLKEKQREFK